MDQAGTTIPGPDPDLTGTEIRGIMPDMPGPERVLPMGALYESNYMGDVLTVTTVGVSYHTLGGRREWFVPRADIAGVRAPLTGLAVSGCVIQTRSGKTYRARCWNGRKARRAIADLLSEVQR